MSISAMTISAVPPSMMAAKGSNPPVGSHAVRSPADVFAEHCARGELAYQVDADGRAVFHPRVGPYEWRGSARPRPGYAPATPRPRGGGPPPRSPLHPHQGFLVMKRVRGGRGGRQGR